MKTMRYIFTALITTAFLCSTVYAQEKQSTKKKEQMMEMIQDSTMRSMMMGQIASNPEMRQEMMSHMRQQMRGNMQQMDRSQMMQNMQMMKDDPEMKERMQKHMKMMQVMMDGEMDQSEMMEMMDDPEMMSMHMTCMQMMQGNKMNKKQGKMKGRDSGDNNQQ